MPECSRTAACGADAAGFSTRVMVKPNVPDPDEPSILDSSDDCITAVAVPSDVSGEMPVGATTGAASADAALTASVGIAISSVGREAGRGGEGNAMSVS